MTETILALPTHLRKRLAQALESGMNVADAVEWYHGVHKSTSHQRRTRER